MGASRNQLIALAAPTEDWAKKSRPAPGRGNRTLTYIDARFVQDRLDTAVGPENWQNKYHRAEESKDGVVCGIGILVQRGEPNDGDEEWVWKSDVGTESNIEETKGSYSDSFKRAGVMWGIGRDLYPGGRADAEKASPVAGTVAAAVAKVPKPKSFPVSNDDAPWICPEHDAVVAWPAGETAEGRKYGAFYACPKGKACTHRAPSGLPVKDEHIKPKPLDDLPF